MVKGDVKYFIKRISMSVEISFKKEFKSTKIKKREKIKIYLILLKHGG